MSTVTALLIVSIVLSIVAVTSIVLSALISSKTISSTNRLVALMHERSGKQLDKTLDRLMTIRWEDFTSMQYSQSPETEIGYQSFPGSEEDEDEGDEGQLIPDIWGKLRDTINDTSTDEDELLAEDAARDEAPRVEA